MSAGTDKRGEALYRIVWRWHFYAGLLVGPVITIVALTGFGYVFKREIETLLHADVLLVERGDAERPLDDLVRDAERATGEGWTTRLVEIDADPSRSFGVFLDGPGGDHRRLFVDQYTGSVLGSISDASFFPVVLRLHRSLFAGTFGRVLTELAACWTVLLVVSGLYLWWPRARKRNRGVFVATVRGFDYRSLRDLHSVTGFWLSSVIVLMAGTGLVYSQYLGKAFQAAAYVTGSYDFLPESEPLASSAAGERRWATALGAARRETPGLLYTIEPRGESTSAMAVYAGGLTGPSLTRVLEVDPRTGAVTASSSLDDFTALGVWGSWNYPLHIGSVFGLPSKVLWAMASLVLAILPITGVWMWLKRRPRGRTGFPKRPRASVPVWVAAVVAVLACVLPVAGVSIAIAALVDRVVTRRLNAR